MDSSLIYFIPIEASLSSTFPSSPPQPFLLLFPSQKGYQPTYQVAIRLVTSSHINTGQDNSVGGKGSKTVPAPNLRKDWVLV